MSLTAGIVGLPNVGKSTLFNAITNAQVEAANYPFATIDPNVGVVEVPDHRLDDLAAIFNPKKTIYTTFEFTDIAGLVKGASRGEGLGNKFLANIRETDAICEVVRCFRDKDITHVDGSVDPVRDVETINLELVMADLETVDKRIGKIEKKAQTTKEKDAVLEYETLKKCENSLMNNIPLRRVEFNDDELLLIKNFNFITQKPIIYAANVSEDDCIIGENEYTKLVKEYAKNDDAQVIVMCAKMESELAELSDDDKKAFMTDLGLTNSGLDKLIFATYYLLGLQTFFTVGKDECRAWTFKKGMKAPECAGLIHSDFQRGFIKAEVTSFNDLEKLGSEKAVQEAGKLRLEGKDYIMQDGDIVLFRFNV